MLLVARLWPLLRQKTVFSVMYLLAKVLTVEMYVKLVILQLSKVQSCRHEKKKNYWNLEMRTFGFF